MGQTLTTVPDQLGGSGKSPGFGQPSVTLPATPTGRTSLASAGGQGAAAGFTTGNAPRSPAYVTTFGASLTWPPGYADKLQKELPLVLARSSSLHSRAGIQVALDGEVVVLRGQVADDHERSLAESLVRLTPGVAQVRNELVVQPAPRATPGHP
jgi:hypothetical protein